MAGIYIHIPFCKQACHYCDFHFSTQTGYYDRMVQAISRELESRSGYLDGKTVSTVYFGGGTPSILKPAAIDRLLETIAKHYALDLEEVTLEANPDDLDELRVRDYRSLGIDRLSIGVQSFHESILRFYNRAHSGEESLRAIDRARHAGFEKLSIDLIYGFPATDHTLWAEDLETALSQDPGHISSYSLTIESRTVLGSWSAKGKFVPPEDDFVAVEFEMLQEAMAKNGYIQYEISNFGKPGQFAVHNTNYWRGVPYLGVGPSAHSFDGSNRGHNVANNATYMVGLEEGTSIFTTDLLTKMDRANEYILTALRTMWGIDLAYLSEIYQINFVKEKEREIVWLIDLGYIKQSENSIVLTDRGKILADSIAEKLFLSFE